MKRATTSSTKRAYIFIFKLGRIFIFYYYCFLEIILFLFKNTNIKNIAKNHQKALIHIILTSFATYLLTYSINMIKIKIIKNNK